MREAIVALTRDLVRIPSQVLYPYRTALESGADDGFD